MQANGRIRVLVADDSAFMRKVLQSILAADAQLELVGEARDGREAVEQAQKLKPDVITMDVNMPHLDGLQATEVIMSTNPRPIVIVSSESREGADTTLRALELGAIDFVTKPSSAVDLDMNSVREELCRKVKMAAKVRVVRTAARSQLAMEMAAPEPLPAGAAPRNGERFPIVTIAASTGGPATLMRLIPSFPRNFNAAVLLVQHMPASFTQQFSQQLAEASQMQVKEAEAGEIVQPGTIYVCPGSHHLRLSPTGRIVLDDGPRVNAYRPCADLTLESVAAYAGPLAVAVVLTGMGNDGARGVQAIKSAGGYVIAQDEASSIIFGMPAEAIRTGAVDAVLDVAQVYSALEKRVLFYQGAAKVGAL